MRMMRCLVPTIDIWVGGNTNKVELGGGLEYDFDRELSPGYTLGQAVAGREECFEPVDRMPPLHVPRDAE